VDWGGKDGRESEERFIDFTLLRIILRNPELDSSIVDININININNPGLALGNKPEAIYSKF